MRKEYEGKKEKRLSKRSGLNGQERRPPILSEYCLVEIVHYCVLIRVVYDIAQLDSRPACGGHGTEVIVIASCAGIAFDQ